MAKSPPVPSERRVRLSARLKAARHLASTYDETRGKLVPLPVSKLVNLEPLASNRMSVSRLEEIEQLRVDPRPMELTLIEEALGLPRGWFGEAPDAEVSQSVADLLRAVATGVQGPAREPGVPHEESA